MPSRHLGETLGALVQRLVESYETEPRTHHIDREFLPERTSIIEICDLLVELTYPGYFGRRGLTRHNILYHVGELLPRLWEALAEQIARCLCHESCADAAAPDEEGFRRRAEDLATRFLERIPDVRGVLAGDVQAAYDGDPAATGVAEIILAYPGLLAITIHRYAHELYEMRVPIVPRIMAEYAHQTTGIDIHPGARIGRGCFIDHGTGVVIGETAELGESVKVYQGVTLGALSFERDAQGRVIRGTKRHPTVGANVTLYANAIVLGGTTMVGDGAVVGGSVFVTQSVPAGYQVAISPPVLKLRPPRTSPEAGLADAPSWDI